MPFDPFSPERMEAIGATMVPLSAHKKTKRMTQWQKDRAVLNTINADPDAAVAAAKAVLAKFDRLNATVTIHYDDFHGEFVVTGDGPWKRIGTLAEAWAEGRRRNRHVRPRVEALAGPRGTLP